ncbi:hypothetical protein S245_022473 [Arachis hypogaea]
MGYFVRVVMCVHMFMLFHFLTCLSSHSCHPEDTSALLHFKNELFTNTTFYEDDYLYAYLCPHVYPKMRTWDNGIDCCSWMGVTCHSLSGHVIGLDLSCSRLAGNIHPNSTLFHLTHLQTLSLAFNDIRGSELPSQIGRLVSLTHLNLSHCQFKGEIPSQISHLSKLQSLDLSWNDDLMWEEKNWKRLLQNTSLREIVLDKTDMSSIGSTPNPLSLIANLSSTLITLSLSYTKIRGYLTNDILCLPNLQKLILKSNKLSVHLFELSCTTFLSILDLSDCGIQGPISSSFSNLTYLTSLNLMRNQLNGSIPSSLLNLHHLTHLDLSWNEISGQIPNVFDRLTNLQTLSLSGNKFQGKLPSSLFTLTQLSQLDCSSNQIEGPLPNKVAFSNLTELLLEDNLLNGTIPSSILSLKYLRTLDLSKNQFTGHISGHQFRWYQFEYLDLSFNLMDDDISSFFCNASSLKVINLSHNRFTGTFSPCFANSSSLVDLDLQMNKLHGTLSDNFKHLQLETLNLNGNQFEGLLPKSLSSCTYIVDLDFVQSRLVDYIDTGAGSGVENILPDYYNSIFATIKGANTPFAKIPTAFVNIDLSKNKFEGEIPNVIGELQALKNLNLSHNRLIGHIPSSLGNLTNLESLDLSSNMFIGDIPTELTNLNFLEILNLSQNLLVGPIPRGKQFETFSNDSYVGNMGLCGFPLSIQCNNNAPLQQDPPSSEAEDKFGFGWKPVAIGYACGMVLGTGLGFCVFSIGKPQWLVIIFGGKRIKRRSRENRRARTT